MDNFNSNYIPQMPGAMTPPGFTGVSGVPFHTHNGTDSPKLRSTFFWGAVAGDGNIIFLPKGWAVSHDGAASPGVYTIIHNHKTTAYGAVATGIYNLGYWVVGIAYTATQFTVYIDGSKNEGFTFFMFLYT